MKKKCSKCGTEKSITEFYKRSSARDGLQSNCKSCKTKYNQSHYIKNVDIYKNRRKVWREQNGKPWQLHNLDEQRFTDMVALHDGRCWMCKEKDFSQIDHDHSCCAGAFSCGQCVRGLLCIGCNTGLGLLGDTLDSLERAMVYLNGYISHSAG